MWKQSLWWTISNMFQYFWILFLQLLWRISLHQCFLLSRFFLKAIVVIFLSYYFHWPTFLLQKNCCNFLTNIFCLGATKIINTDINECESVENLCSNETLKCLNYPGSYNCSYIEGCIFLHLFIVYCLLLLGAGNAYMRRQHINILYPISVFH